MCLGPEQSVLLPDVLLHFHNLHHFSSVHFLVMRNGAGLLMGYKRHVAYSGTRAYEGLTGILEGFENIIGSELWKENCRVAIHQHKIKYEI